MTSLTKRLTGKGTRQAMEYEGGVGAQCADGCPQHAIVSMAKKVKDNVLHVMTAPVIMPLSTTPKIPEANPPGILPKAPNALVIK